MALAGGVWWATARPVDPALLDAATRARVAALRRPDDRHRHATAARLGDLLARAHAGADARVRRRRGAPPRVVGGIRPLHMSVSHAGPHVAVAIAPHHVGVDVEPAGAAGAAAAGHAAALAPAEAAALAALAPHARPAALLRLWVRKEAVLKAAGVGLTVDPRRLVLEEAAGGPAVVAAPPLPVAGAVAVRDLHGPTGSVAALAVIGGPLAGIGEHDGDALLAAGAADGAP